LVEELKFHVVNAAMVRRMKVAKTIDDALPARTPTPAQVQALRRGEALPADGPSVGTCVEAMVVNILEGRVALYGMEVWLKALPVGMFWGPDVQPSQFTDDRLARALDSLWDQGLDEMYATMVKHWGGEFRLTLRQLFCDGSTVGLQGAYDLPPDEPGPVPERGYSKDNDRANKQFVLASTVQQDGIPVAFTVQDGAMSDSVLFRTHLGLLQQQLSELEQDLFVGDCKMCDQETLGVLRAQGLHALTRLPRTFKAHDTLIQDALAHPACWTELLNLPGRTSQDPQRIYRGYRTTMPMPLLQPGKDGKLYEEIWSALVVHSSELERSHRESYARRLENEKLEWEARLCRERKERFSSPEEAAVVLDKLQQKQNKSVGWKVMGRTEQETVPAKRAVGRPRKDEVPQTRTAYRLHLELEADLERQEQEKREHGLFVIVQSRLLQSDSDAREGLQKYREKSVVEEGFRWTKAPSQVAPVLLHTPTRVAALGFVFAVALAAYRITQKQIRDELSSRQETIPGHHGRPTQSPTVHFLMRVFANVLRVTLRTEEKVSYVLQGWTPLHERILDLLGLPRDLYTRHIL
jgi:transposase